MINKFAKKLKGIWGELKVRLLIKLFLNKNDYHVLNNVMLSTEKGTTQIDHVIISQYGIFVLETKNMKGWIFGSEHQKIWTQVIYRLKNKFQNPIHQNYKHVKAIENITNVKNEKIFTLIVFIGDSKFKTDMPKYVTYASNFINYIKSKEERILSRNDVENIKLIINDNKVKNSIENHLKHVSDIKDKISNDVTDTIEKNKACHKCGSDMILRTVKSGKNKGNKFWGCSNFPKCRARKAV